MGVNFNVVVAPRTYVGLYRPDRPVFFAASPVFFHPAPLVSAKTALGITAAAVGLGVLSHAFNSRARPPLTDHNNRMHLQPSGGRLATQQGTPPQTQQGTPPQAQQGTPPQAQQGTPPQAQSTPSKPPGPPKVATPLADALDGAKGLKNGSADPKAVTTLQKFLQKAGYGEKLGKTGTSNDGVDGVFGNRTGSALEQFQIDNHLQITGILDEATVKKMHEVEQRMALAPDRPEASPPKVSAPKPEVQKEAPRAEAAEQNPPDSPAGPYRTREFARRSSFPPPTVG